VEEEEDEPKMKCLIANDEDMQLNVLKFLFSNKNYEVVIAHNGFEAFQEVQKSLGSIESLFDLILLDLSMPITDGYEACRKITNLFQEDSIKIDKDSSISLKLSELKPIMLACSSMMTEIER